MRKNLLILAALVALASILLGLSNGQYLASLNKKAATVRDELRRASQQQESLGIADEQKARLAESLDIILPKDSDYNGIWQTLAKISQDKGIEIQKTQFQKEERNLIVAYVPLQIQWQSTLAEAKGFIAALEETGSRQNYRFFAVDKIDFQQIEQEKQEVKPPEEDKGVEIAEGSAVLDIEKIKAELQKKEAEVENFDLEQEIGSQNLLYQFSIDVRAYYQG